MSLQPLGARQRHCRRSKCCERCCIKLQDRGSLHEVENSEARRKSGTACRREYVIGSGHIVPDHLGSHVPDENGASIANALGQIFRILQLRFPNARQRYGRPTPELRRANSKRSWRQMRSNFVPRYYRAARFAAAGRQLARRRLRNLRHPSSVSIAQRYRVRLARGGRLAIHSGSLCLSAMTSTSDGPAMKSMPTTPNTWRLAAAT